jgi:hypothetical protein
MAAVNTARQDHIIPLYLKGAAVTMTESDDGAISLDTSYVKFDIGAGSSNAFTLADGTIPGQIMILWAQDADNTNKAVITVANTIFAENDVITLNDVDENITLMWIGNAWAPLGFSGATRD